MQLARNVCLQLGSPEQPQRMSFRQIIGRAINSKQIVGSAVKGLAQALHKLEADALLINTHKAADGMVRKTVLGKVARETFDALLFANAW